MADFLNLIKEEVTYDYGIPDGYADFGGSFPHDGIEILRKAGLLTLNVPLEIGGRGLGEHSGNDELLSMLRKVGSYDLSLGRIYEGHLNALLLISRHGTKDQKQRYFKEALDGVLFGIWNSELPNEPLTYIRSGNRYELSGAKVFCSGGACISRPIVTADGPEGTFMVLLDMNHLQLIEDMTYWKPMGMQSSVSCRFDFTGVCIEQNDIIGGPYAYVGEPDFTAGAARFAAVQLGGAEAAIRTTVRHLQNLKRTEAPEQAMRLAKLALLREDGRIWTDSTGNVLDARYHNPSASMYQANMYRTMARQICEKVLAICEKSVGLQGMLQPHSLERIHRDLSVYLKQPGPDRTLMAIADNFAKQDGYWKK